MLINNFIIFQGLYRECAEVDDGQVLAMDPRNVQDDRYCYYCTNIPGENDWVQEGWEKKHSSEPINETGDFHIRGTKRVAPDELEIEGFEDDDIAVDQKKPKAVSDAQPARVSASEAFDLSFPIAKSGNKACLAKFYEQCEDIKLNDMIEIVGIYSFDPILSEHLQDQASNEEEDMDTDCSFTLPSSLVPRIHVLTAKVLPHDNPLVPQAISSQIIQNDVITKTRSELHSLLSRIFLGDNLCADYYIFHLISSIYKRTDVLALGSYPLNITNVEPIFGAKFFDFVTQITTHSQFIALTLNSLNNDKYIPKKDYKLNKLLSGKLQFAKNTNFVIDETQLSVGQLNERGLRNLNSVVNLVKWQRVDYDFEYHSLGYDTDVVILVFSEGKSLIPIDCRVILKVRSDSFCKLNFHCAFVLFSF